MPAPILVLVLVLVLMLVVVVVAAELNKRALMDHSSNTEAVVYLTEMQRPHCELVRKQGQRPARPVALRLGSTCRV